MPDPTEAESLDDLEFPSLQNLLAEYVGALKLREFGNVDEAFVARRLQRLQVCCRAADRLVKMMAVPAAQTAREARAQALQPEAN